jgi:hypothetical protein
MANTPVNLFTGMTPIADLPADFRQCILDPTGVGCDEIVGSRTAGYGYCSSTSYATQPYCACVNNLIPCPMVAASACANNTVAYRPRTMRPGGPAFETCKTQPICVNAAQVGGQQNIVSGLVQQCGTIQNVQSLVQGASPGMWALLLILVILVVQVVSQLTAPVSQFTAPVEQQNAGLNTSRGTDT